MHDLDRTLVGSNSQFESFNYEFGEAEGELNESEAMDLAHELMEVNTEQEFDYFLGDLINKAGSAIKNFAGSSTGQAIGGMLKSAAQNLLPAAGKALGTYLGGPAGANIGSQLGQAAGGLFSSEAEAEAEAEELEWEAANTFVKLAHDAAKNAAAAPPSSNPQTVARQAVIESAAVHAPHLAEALAKGTNGLSKGSASTNGTAVTASSSGAQSGRWVRHHDRIILIGI